MTTTLRSDIRAQLGWTWQDHADAAPITDSNRLEFQRELGDGAGADQADAVWHVENQSLDEGAAITLDLAALERSLFGDTLITALTGVRAILIVNRPSSAGSLLVGGAEVNAWYAPFGSASDRARVMPGGSLLLAHPAEGWQVGAGASALRIETFSGEVVYDVAILGTTTAGGSSSGS